MAAVSVIVPVFNLEKELPYCVDCLHAQTVDDFELLLVDDGSNDASGKLCDSYILADQRVVVVHQRNGGVSVARNVGISLGHSDYISFIDGDDLVVPHYLERLLNRIQGHALVVCGYEKIETYEHSLQPKRKVGATMAAEECANRLLCGRFPISACCALFRADRLETVRFLPGVRANEDKLFLYEYLLYCYEELVSFSDERLYGYRTRKGSATQTVWNGSLDVVLVADRILELTKVLHPEWIEAARRAAIVARLATIKEGLRSKSSVGWHDEIFDLRREVLNMGPLENPNIQLHLELFALRLGLGPYKLLTDAYYLLMNPGRQEKRNQRRIRQVRI